MKLLFLSVCGKLDEPEDTKYINLYLASLKQNVVPYFDVKVILLTTYKIENLQESLLQKQIDEYGLSDIIELKTINELELPEKSLTYIKTVNWFNRIGIHMNVLYDYSSRYNFFNADWIFHVDTDSEFLENFQTCITTINELKKVHPRIVISLAGDSYPSNIVSGSTEYVFTEVARANFYEGDGADKQDNFVVIDEKEMREDDHRRKYNSMVFSPSQMKVRNDFVGISREASSIANFNWVFMYYHEQFKDNGPLQTMWPDKALKLDDNNKLYEVPVPQIHINYHMGGMLQYKLHSNEVDIVRVQLPGYTHAVHHYSSGWFNGNFIERSLETLNSKYQDTKEIWNKDYE